MFMFINSPLEQFETVPFISLTAPIIGDFNLSLTNLGFYVFIVIFLIIGLHTFGNNSFMLVPSAWSISIETIFVSIQSIVREQIGSANEIFMPFIYSLFMFILIANLNGNIPYGYTITTSLIIPIGISVFVFIAVTIIGLAIHRVHFFSFFIPSGTPLALVPVLIIIEIISYFARSVSLGVRLFSNCVAGHTLLKILSTFLMQLFSSSVIIALFTLIPFAIFVALIGLELAVSFIQAFVFSILVCSYIKDAVELH